MIIKRLDEIPEIVALDNTVVKESLNPNHSDTGLKLGYSLAHASLRPRTSSLPHRFKEASEVYFILKGQGMMRIDDEVRPVVQGDTIYIGPMQVQSIENVGDGLLEFLCIVYPAWQPDAEELV